MQLINKYPKVLSPSEIAKREKPEKIDVEKSILEEINKFCLTCTDGSSNVKEFDDTCIILENEKINEVGTNLRNKRQKDENLFDDFEEKIDKQEIFDLISGLLDPEHPLTLAELSIVNIDDIEINYDLTGHSFPRIKVELTPTISHCSLATIIGLCVKIHLQRCLHPKYRVKILIKKGTHVSDDLINQQLNDKERVLAAVENLSILKIIKYMTE